MWGSWCPKKVVCKSTVTKGSVTKCLWDRWSGTLQFGGMSMSIAGETMVACIGVFCPLVLCEVFIFSWWHCGKCFGWVLFWRKTTTQVFCWDCAGIESYHTQLLLYTKQFPQEFLLSAAVKLPELTLSDDFLGMGTVHLEKSSTSSFTISNLSVSRAVWTTGISQGNNAKPGFSRTPSLVQHPVLWPVDCLPLSPSHSLYPRSIT